MKKSFAATAKNYYVPILYIKAFLGEFNNWDAKWWLWSLGGWGIKSGIFQGIRYFSY